MVGLCSLRISEVIPGKTESVTINVKQTLKQCRLMSETNAHVGSSGGVRTPLPPLILLDPFDPLGELGDLDSLGDASLDAGRSDVL